VKDEYVSCMVVVVAITLDGGALNRLSAMVLDKTEGWLRRSPTTTNG